jgi:hypothetical protein
VNSCLKTHFANCWHCDCVSDGFWNCLSQINMMKIIASAALQRYPQHPNAMQHALEQSILYSEELGIDLARETMLRASAGFWQAFCSVPEFRRRQLSELSAHSCAMA